MDLPKGWISRQITRLEKEYLTWPDWMKRERNQKMDNFIGTWKTRNNSKVTVLRKSGPDFTGKVIDPYVSPDGEVWDSNGNHTIIEGQDLMERISEKDPRR